MLTDKEKQTLNLLDSLERLRHNQDFKKLVTNYYCQELPLEVMTELNQFTTSSESYAEKVRILDSVSVFKAFLNQLEEEGQTIKDNESYLTRIPDEEFLNV